MELLKSGKSILYSVSLPEGLTVSRCSTGLPTIRFLSAICRRSCRLKAP